MRTYIDPIRYVQNSSSGVLGLEIARALKARNPHLEITSLVGPVDSAVREGFAELGSVLPYATAQDYERNLLPAFTTCDLFVSCAAVLDFSVDTSPTKLARQDLENLPELRLPKANVPDYAGWVGNEFKTARQKIFAFSLDTAAEASAIMRAKEKVLDKNADWIFVNFATDTQGPEKSLSSGVILNHQGDIAKRLRESPKALIAGEIADFLIKETPLL